MQKSVVILVVFVSLLFQAEARQKSLKVVPLKPKYVVATNGSDDNPGTAKKPFATIQKAADVAIAGDVVLVKAGRYYEQVVLKNSGTAEKPIIFTGERGTDGSWLSITGPGMPVTDWEPAPEVGPGVYKTTSVPFNPFCITIAGKQILRIADRHMARDKDKLLPLEELKNIKNALERQEDGVGGFNLLRLPADSMVDYSATSKIPYWDAIEANYGYLNGITYIRFRNGDDPSQKNIAASPQGAGFLIEDKNNIVLRNFFVTGADTAVAIKGEKATDNIVEDNFLANGRKRITITDKAARNIIQNNRMTLNYYGYPGKPHPNIYREYKHTQGPNGSDDQGISVRLAGVGNIIRYNRIYVGLIGIHVSLVPELEVYGNIISDMCSIGICTSVGANGTFHENLIFNNAINLRIHHYNEVKAKNVPFIKRKEYYYRNFFFQSGETGYQVFIHNVPVTYFPRKYENPEQEPEIFFYHNTFSGGTLAFNISYESKLVPAGDTGGMRQSFLLNNIFSFTAKGALVNTWRVWNSPDLFKSVDNNWIVMPEELIEEEKPVWYGKNNIFSTSVYKWQPDTQFTLTKDNPFLEKGLDLSKKFIIDGKEYGPLPGMAKGYFKGKKPDLGALQYGENLRKRFLLELKESGILE